MTRSGYMRRLKILLSIFYDSNDVCEILEDCEDLLDNCTFNDKEEKEICKKLGSPIKLLHMVIRETNRSIFYTIAHSSMLQVVGLVIGYVLCVGILKNVYFIRDNNMFLELIVFLNLFFFLSGELLFKSKSDLNCRLYSLKLINGIVFATNIMFIVFSIIMVDKVFLLEQNIMYTSILRIAMIAVFFITIVILIKYIPYNKKTTFYLIFQFIVTFSIILNILNESGQLYSSENELKIKLFKGMFLIIESVILIFFSKLHRWRKKRYMR